MNRVITALILAIGIIACQEKASQTDIVSHIAQMSLVMSDNTTQAISDKEIDKVFYLVRHAEKDTLPKDNPRLTEKGEQRAAALADIFRKTRIDEVYSTMYTRTLWTAEGVTQAKGINVKPYDPSELKAFAEQLKQNTEIKTALIVGHSNTTTQLTTFLADAGADELNKIDESEYDGLYIVVIHEDGTAMIKQQRYFTDRL